MQLTADLVSLRAQQMVPKIMKEAILGIIACFNPDI